VRGKFIRYKEITVDPGTVFIEDDTREVGSGSPAARIKRAVHPARQPLAADIFQNGGIFMARTQRAVNK
jgi:hypothetical protein